jgi:hypothetical protein
VKKENENNITLICFLQRKTLRKREEKKGITKKRIQIWPTCPFKGLGFETHNHQSNLGTTHYTTKPMLNK